MPAVPVTPTYPNPQPVSNSLIFGSSIGFDASATIEIRQRWGDNWTANDQLVCTSINWAAAPTIPTATLVYRYGETLERDGSTINVREKLVLGGWYVRITVTCADGVRKWHGFVDDSADEPAGLVSRSTGGGPVLDAVGVQTFSCVGMIAALDRSPIFNCWYVTVSADQLSGYTLRRPGMSAPAFNPKSNLAEERGHQRQIKNRSPSLSTVPAFQPSTAPTYPATLPDISRETYLLFTPDLLTVSGTGEYWTPRDIAKYLVAYHGPRDEVNKEQIPVWLYEDSAIDAAAQPLPNWGQPELDCDGKTLKGCLDELMSQRQSLGYWVWVQDETNRLMIEPYTLLESDLTVGTSKTITANPKWLDATVSSDPATSSTVQRNESSLANQVVIRGAKRIAVCTLRINNNTSSASAHNMYQDQAGIAGYNAEFSSVATLRDQYAARDALQSGQYKNIYRNYPVGTRWGWTVQIGDTYSSATFEDMFRNDDPDLSGYFANDNSRYLPHMYRARFLPNLPLKEGIDYSTGTDATASEHRNSTKGFRDLEAYGKSHGDGWVTATGTMTGRGKLWSDPAKRDVLYDVNDPDYSLEVNPLPSDYGLGLQINVVGASQLTLGTTDPNTYVPRLPVERLLLTVAIEDDRHVSQHWPATSPGVDGVLRRVFDLGDTQQLIEILPSTVLGINGDGTFKRRGDRFFVRDDRPRMLELAKQLQKWYSTPRNIARIVSRRSTARLWPGQLVKKLNPSPVSPPANPHEVICNCVITEVSMSFPIGTPESPGKPSMSIVTSRGEVDPMIFQPRLV
jgi:hypothetical protein